MISDLHTDLIAQQEHLTSSGYDLRISSLAQFLYRKATQQRDNSSTQQRRNSVTQNDNAIEGTRFTIHDPRSTFHNSRRRLLDVGAGNGLILKYFKRHGFEVHGIELEEKLVDELICDKELEGCNIRCGDITQMKGDASYDVVIASDVIEHIEDDGKAVRQLWTFVKPGGILLLTVPAHPFLYCERDKNWGHFRRYSKKMLRDVCVQSTGVSPTLTYWNTLGFPVYYVCEHILHTKQHENLRYNSSLFSKFTRAFVSGLLRIEEYTGGTEFGLTLVGVLRKNN